MYILALIKWFHCVVKETDLFESDVAHNNLHHAFFLALFQLVTEETGQGHCHVDR